MLTILTATFNRADKLLNLYESLLNQSSHKFEWLIIDDGSTDETRVTIENLLDTSPFKIIYLKKNNGGKHTALNIGFQEANYDWIFMVDSDDTLHFDVVNVINRHILKLPSSYNSISMLKAYKDGTVVGDLFPNNIVNYIERINYGVKGDKADVIRKEALKNFSFPEFPNENFMAESPLYLWLGERGYTLFLNYKGYICEYLSDGLSNSSIRNRHRCVNSSLFVYETQYLKFNRGSLKVKAAANWWRFKLFKNNINHTDRVQIPYIYLPLGLALYIKDKISNEIYKP